MTSTVELEKVPLATTLAALASGIMNVVLWLGGAAIGRMTIGWGEVVIMSALGAVAGGVCLALLGRYSREPVRRFALVTIVVLVLYALGPVSAAYAPYMEGAERFNVETVVVTELMHLASGAAVYFILTRRATR